MFINNKRKKMRNRVIFAAAGVFLLSFGIWLNYQAQPEDTAEDVVKNVQVK